MKVSVSNSILIENPSNIVKSWIEENLRFVNPEYEQKLRMGKYLGNTPKELILFERRGYNYEVPYGTGAYIQPYLKDAQIVSKFAKQDALTMTGSIDLYDYQKKAVIALMKGRNGMLVAPCGSGKTQIGIALIKALGMKALWVTHTIELLNQSMDRAKAHFEGDFGKITGGKVEIGNDITFATVQTLSAIDLAKYRDEWNVIIVDEAHKAVGGPTKVMMFYKVLSSLSARHKYGLSATFKPKAKSHISNTTAYIIGPTIHEISKKEVDDKIIKSKKEVINLLTPFSKEFLSFDGMLDFNALITYLVNNEYRNREIVKLLKENKGKKILILSHRVDHLYLLQKMLGDGTVIVGATPKSERTKIMDDAREGKIDYLFSTYSLAKEGLDIPILNRLVLATPQKDYVTVVQSVGRIERNFVGKVPPVVFDLVDINIPHLIGFYNKRKSHYNKS